MESRCWMKQTENNWSPKDYMYLESKINCLFKAISQKVGSLGTWTGALRLWGKPSTIQPHYHTATSGSEFHGPFARTIYPTQLSDLIIFRQCFTSFIGCRSPPVLSCLTIKIATLTFKVLKFQQPAYIYDLIAPYIPPRSLRSSNKNLHPLCLISDQKWAADHFPLLNCTFHLEFSPST